MAGLDWMISPSRTTSTYGSGRANHRRLIRPQAECAADASASDTALERRVVTFEHEDTPWGGKESVDEQRRWETELTFVLELERNGSLPAAFDRSHALVVLPRWRTFAAA